MSERRRHPGRDDLTVARYEVPGKMSEKRRRPGRDDLTVARYEVPG